ncbi:MAG: DUF3810 domain-containing protein [Tenacibaculum sp.]
MISSVKSRNITLIIASLLPFQYLLVRWLSKYPSTVEQYYSKGAYPYISKALRLLFGWIPFSVGEVLGLILIVALVKSIYGLFTGKFKKIISVLLNLIASISIIYFCFYAFWGLNYFREPLAKNLKLKTSKYTNIQLFLTSQKIVELLNQSHFNITQNDTVRVVVPYSSKQIFALALKGFTDLAKEYPQLAYSTSSIKNSALSLFQSYSGTSGYLNPISGEAQVNYQIPKNSFPVTTCHEIAHQIGWAAENDANFIGFLASIYHANAYFRYAGYRMAFQYCISQLQKRDAILAKQIKRKVNKGIFKDFNNSYLHWKKYENPMEPYFKKAYHSYLKANKQKKGIDSYDYVVDLLIAYFKNK